MVCTQARAVTGVFSWGSGRARGAREMLWFFGLGEDGGGFFFLMGWLLGGFDVRWTGEGECGCARFFLG